MPRPRAVRTLAPQPAPANIYESNYSLALGVAICERLAKGESLRAICKDPEAPTAKTIWNWSQRHPEFAWMYDEALMQARAAARAKRQARDAARTAAKAAMRTARGWRPTPPWPDTYSEERAAAVLWRLAEGRGLAEICHDPDLPSIATVYNWLKRYPAFATEYREVRKLVRDAMLMTAREEAPWLGAVAASQRELRRREKSALRRGGFLWPRGFTGPPWRRRLIETPVPAPPGETRLELNWDDDEVGW